MPQAQADPLVTITEVVSDAVETPMEDLPALRESVEPEALAALLTDDRSRDVTVAFTYAGRDVIVSSGGIVYVRPPDCSATARREVTYSDRR